MLRLKYFMLVKDTTGIFSWQDTTLKRPIESLYWNNQAWHKLTNNYKETKKKTKEEHKGNTYVTQE